MGTNKCKIKVWTSNVSFHFLERMADLIHFTKCYTECGLDHKSRTRNISSVFIYLGFQWNVNFLVYFQSHNQNDLFIFVLHLSTLIRDLNLQELLRDAPS